ncbi:hypothetical protein BpHYR1_038376 [Brachionus plicatilis]|uniref:Uncharacterized protein n=1 Tax=Brachionus plicatilis TaxID=10195 RepID=A0A3M7R2B4_BRAPC|nr:hypothetical protein BpHYR1_038376 [Brachionus plicatilis]
MLILWLFLNYGNRTVIPEFIAYKRFPPYDIVFNSVSFVPNFSRFQIMFNIFIDDCNSYLFVGSRKYGNDCSFLIIIGDIILSLCSVIERKYFKIFCHLINTQKLINDAKKEKLRKINFHTFNVIPKELKLGTSWVLKLNYF